MQAWSPFVLVLSRLAGHPPRGDLNQGFDIEAGVAAGADPTLVIASILLLLLASCYLLVVWRRASRYASLHVVDICIRSQTSPAPALKRNIASRVWKHLPFMEAQQQQFPFRRRRSEQSKVAAHPFEHEMLPESMPIPSAAPSERPKRGSVIGFIGAVMERMGSTSGLSSPSASRSEHSYEKVPRGSAEKGRTSDFTGVGDIPKLAGRLDVGEQSDADGLSNNSHSSDDDVTTNLGAPKGRVNRKDGRFPCQLQISDEAGFPVHAAPSRSEREWVASGSPALGLILVKVCLIPPGALTVQ